MAPKIGIKGTPPRTGGLPLHASAPDSTFCCPSLLNAAILSCIDCPAPAAGTGAAGEEAGEEADEEAGEEADEEAGEEAGEEADEEAGTEAAGEGAVEEAATE